MADTSFDAPPAGTVPDRPVSLVTGGTGAIGAAVVRRLATRGDHVLVVGRDADRGASVVDRATRGVDGTARFFEADLSSQARTRALAGRIRRIGRLDRFVAAVGGFSSEARTTGDGVEYTLAVNYLSTYLLAHELVDRMVGTVKSHREVDREDGAGGDREADGDGDGGNRDGGDHDWGTAGSVGPARVVTLTASVPEEPIEVGELGPVGDDYGRRAAHATAKRCLTAFTLELADRLPPVVAADAVVPGVVVESRSTADLPWYLRYPARALRHLPVGDGPEVAAGRVVDVATDRSGASGRVVDGEEPVDVPDFAADPAARDRLWRRSADLVGVDPDWP